MKNFFKAFVYAARGIVAAFASERNLKVHAILAVITVSAGLYCRITSLEWCAIILCIGLVIAVEIINTSIEHLVNLVTKEWHPLAGKIKDTAAGAVLVISITSLIVGIIIFRKYLMP